jgi:CRISPR-associated protein Cas1
MVDDLHQLARFDDRLSYLYVEHARLDQCDKAIAIHDQTGTTPVPVATLALLMLGPGTTITHAAMRSLADNNCLVTWVGEQAVRVYAHSTGGTRSAAALLRQAALVSDPLQRLAVVRRMYRRRFPSSVDLNLTLQQLRGMEGIRVREAYATASRKTGVEWRGRQYDRRNWAATDDVNKALSCANSCLYGIAHAAILSVGYSAALGFIHTGKQLSFVYDVSDLYKAELTIPLAFEVVAAGGGPLERQVRLACRDRFKSARLLERILPDIAWVLDVENDPRAELLDTDPAHPGRLWDPDLPDGAEGGQSYGSDTP